MSEPLTAESLFGPREQKPTETRAEWDARLNRLKGAQVALDAAARQSRVPDVTSVISEHRFNLVFEDEVGDLARCSCGEQGYDFEQGWEWYGKHVLARLAPPHPDAEAADTATGGTR